MYPVTSTNKLRSFDPCFHLLPLEADSVVLPRKFTFPFYYEPHHLAVTASRALQEKLLTLRIDHNFGLAEGQSGLVIGKMFGVLVVKDASGRLGYLSAFSGKLGDENIHEGFVPPVFDMLLSDGFFKQEEGVLNGITEKIVEIENGQVLLDAKQRLFAVEKDARNALGEQREIIKLGKQERKKLRERAQVTLGPEEQVDFEAKMVKLSLDDQYTHKRMIKFWRGQIAEAEEALGCITSRLNDLLQERKDRSKALQQRLFEQYTFLNASGVQRSLLDIFSAHAEGTPPAGAGECAAPKLLHHAFVFDYHPIAMAEFWWGASPKSEVRKHLQFYPACLGKCGPILSHMLQGLEVEDNPMLANPALGKVLDIVHEDDYLLVVNKPAEFLSVPGKNIEDSVYLRIKQLFPHATGPLIVHRLDMSTSGILLLAKTKEVHKKLQAQFLNRLVIKRYVAILDGELKSDAGEIDLPLRVDLEDRPRQLVCFEHGKRALTRWQRLEVVGGKTRVHFFPITGRTHQLRVHAAHQLGLNTPIVGDDLYGSKQDRLHLHAEKLVFTHPITKVQVEIEVPAPF